MPISVRAAALSCLILVLAGCGGGGSSKDLYVSVSYGSTTADLYSATVFRPTLSGFEGHEARCDQESGALPAGMQINNDCSISGRPVEVGNFTVGFKVRAEGANGSVSGSANVTVVGPAFGYAAQAGTLYPGALVNDTPQAATGTWSAPAGDTTVLVTYGVLTGSLAPGLMLDARTGVISGQLTTPGTSTATIQLTLSTPFGTYKAPAAVYARSVTSAESGVRYSGLNRAFVSQTYVNAPATPQRGSLATFTLVSGQLPPGLAINPVTGVISGLATAPSPQATYAVSALLSDGGVSYPISGEVSITAEYPTTAYYFARAYGFVGQPVLGLGVVLVSSVSNVPLSSDAVTVYSAPAGSCLNTIGLSVRSADGMVFGTPTIAFDGSCDVDMTTTNNGITWTRRLSVPVNIAQ